MSSIHKYRVASEFQMMMIILLVAHLVSMELMTNRLRERKNQDRIDGVDVHWQYPDESTEEIYDDSLPILKPEQITKTKRSKANSIPVQPTTFTPARSATVTTPSADVTAQTGSLAVLHCDTSSLRTMENVTIKWFKRNKISRDILTLMEETVNDDKRFLVVNDNKDWSLHIRYTQPKDEGLYQCQICTNGTSDSCINVNTTLKLEEAHAKIIDGPFRIIPAHKELPLRLSCVLINSIEPPVYIFWYHDDRMINYDLEDGATVREGRQGSELIFPKANQTHSGNYSCVPSNAQLDSVMVYYREKGNLPPSNKGSQGREKFQPHHILNMLVLVLVSTFHLGR